MGDLRHLQQEVVTKMGLFGSNKKHNVRLTEKQIKELTRNMSSKEQRQFKSQQKEMQQKQKQREDDAFWDGTLWESIFLDND